jgi:ATP-dependent Lon protease
MSGAATLPVLPLKNTVLFPHTLAPLSVGRPLSIRAVEAAANSEEKELVVVAQRDAATDEPSPEGLFRVGTRAVIKRMFRTPDGIQLLVLGLERVELRITATAPHLQAEVTPQPLAPEEGPEVEALQRRLIELGSRIHQLAQPEAEIDFASLMRQLEQPLHLIYLLASLVSLELSRAQALLEAPSHLAALRQLNETLEHEVLVLELQSKIDTAAKSEMSREQREYFLRQQLQAIRQELGEQDPETASTVELRRRIDESELPKDVRKECARQINRLELIPTASPEHQVVRSYIELILELPWSKLTEDQLDLKRAGEVLDADHFGLEEIKDRILEHLAVMKLNPEAHAPILCFVGPPGVGKTSLGQSIARALGRKFERFSLGGLHDEAELRGHRRTYIGAMPGRIIQAIRRAGVRNPLLMLDEVDKLGRDFRGDPAAALLEILDPAQNDTFRDNHLDLPFDLSKVFFILTANTTDSIPRPLLDRVELIRLSGYTDEEKREIARRYLLPRRCSEAGLTEGQLVVPDETLMYVIHRYTRESGVRELERMLGSLARKVARRVAEGDTSPMTVRIDDLADLLGKERFFLEEARATLPPGVATGLAWTETGGDVLYIEVLQLPEGEKLRLTGHLGEVMQESAQAAQSYILANAARLGISKPSPGLHLHVPAGAVPKDGPSAGVTIATAIASLYTGLSVRDDTAMTGEITLTGLVLPVGGIKEKVLAARRAGLQRIILPAANEADLRDLPSHIRESLEFIRAARIEDVLTSAIPGLADRITTASAART